MITLSLNNLISRFIFLVALLLFVSGGFGAAQADPITLHARLVLGTCKEDKSKTEVSDKIRKRLAKVFKWMKYYELRIQNELNIADATTKSAKLSKTASIKVTNRKNGKIAVSLYSKRQNAGSKNPEPEARKLHGPRRQCWQRLCLVYRPLQASNPARLAGKYVSIFFIRR